MIFYLEEFYYTASLKKCYCISLSFYAEYYVLTYAVYIEALIMMKACLSMHLSKKNFCLEKPLKSLVLNFN